MATQDHSGSFVLEVAELGKRLMAAYIKFIIYRKVGDRRLENLYATLSISTEMLIDLGTTLNKYEKDVIIKDQITRSVTETCKANFEKFLVMINQGNERGIWRNDGTIGATNVNSEVDPWFLMTMALGGREETKSFWNSLDDTRNTLIELNDLVKYMVLKDLAKKDILDPEEEQEYAQRRSFLPHLVESLQKGIQIRKEEAEDAAARENRKKNSEWVPPPPPPPGLRRRFSDASSDITLPVEPRFPRYPKEIDIDSSSISSVSSCSVNSCAPEPKEDPTEIYEEWILRWSAPNKTFTKSYSILGLKLKSSEHTLGYWVTDPEYRTQAEMKEQHEYASADLSPSKHKEAMQKAIQAIPKDGGQQIDILLEERTDVSSHDAQRKWSVVAVRPQQKYPYSSKKKWGKDPLTTDWIVTIKGETVDTIKRDRYNRWENPFERRSRSRSRSYSRDRRVVPPYPRRRPGRMIRGPPPPPPPPFHGPPVIINRGRSPMRPFPIRRRSPRRASPFRGPEDDDEYRFGNVVVGKIPTVEEAEKKILEIWQEMNTEKAAEEAEPEVVV